MLMGFLCKEQLEALEDQDHEKRQVRVPDVWRQEEQSKGKRKDAKELSGGSQGTFVQRWGRV